LDNAKLDNAELDNVLAPLAPRLGGILISELSVPVTSAQVEIIEKAQRYAPVVAPWDALTAAGESLASLQNVGCYWRPEEIDLTVCGGGLGIAELTSGVSHDPKALKNILQHCRSLQGATTIGVFFGGDAPRIEEIHNAIMILQLMG
jgi:hypothetical protein